MKLELNAKELKFVLACCDEVISEYEDDGSCRDVDAARAIKGRLLQLEAVTR
jgi:hypothetical protein